MQSSGFDKEGNPLSGQKQEAKMNIMGIDIFNIQSEGFDKDGKPIPGKQQITSVSTGGMPNLQEF